ncbi:hypothetical protein HanIR_Chr13g0626131 [Helianthus annuus]|nr:hypothetical protein HanIR_Chr13g0626131 [Helianthus annuus]
MLVDPNLFFSCQVGRSFQELPPVLFIVNYIHSKFRLLIQTEPTQLGLLV